MPEIIADPFVGHVVDGRYLVLERLAYGGMATVYRATDRRLGREVALKVMNPGFIGDTDGGDFGSRFRREARSAARLTHPGMVRVYDQGSDGDLNYLTMELVAGPNLRQVLTTRGTLPLGEALGTVDRLLDALGAAHRQGLVHRDIKPENVLIDTDGLPKLADFGIARAATEVTATATGTVLGTVAYLAPELVRSGIGDMRSDVYAIGVLLFELITGRQPFTGGSAVEVASRHVHEDVPPPSTYVSWLPPEVDSLVGLLTARDPQSRPLDANEALAALRQARSMIDEPTLARKADAPSGTRIAAVDPNATISLEPTPTGATVALPIGLGELAIIGEAEDEPMAALAPYRPPGKPKTASWIVAVSAAAAVLTALAIWWYSTIGPGGFTTVPNVDGFTAVAATDAIHAAGLEVKLTDAFDDNVEAGKVVGTEPAGDQKVARAGTVTVTVSKGVLRYEMPAVVGISEADASQAITAKGFPPPTIERRYDDEVDSGTILSADQEAHTAIRHDTKITLVVSAGPEPIEMPSVIGLTEADAKALLVDTYAMDVGVEHGRTLEPVATGQVYQQDPDVGDDSHRAADVTIWISDGKPLVTVYSYYFTNKDTAKAELEELGLVVVLKKQHFWSLGSTVVDQSIAPGTEVEIGTTITLTYG